jgi:uncharacterized protein YndB with AHSA1/START domain
MIEEQGTLQHVDGRWMLRFERRLSHPVGRVWQMITEPEGLAGWFPARVEYTELAVGGKLRFVFSQQDLERARDAGVTDVPLVTTGTIRELRPEHVFAFDWEGELVRFELTPDAAGCLLVFLHVFDPDRAQAPRNATGWHLCLDGLRRALAGQEPKGHEREAELVPLYSEALAEAMSQSQSAPEA